MNKRIRKKIDWRCGYRKYSTYSERVLWFEEGIVRLEYIKTKYLCNPRSRYCRIPSRPRMLQPLGLDMIEMLKTKPNLPSPIDPEVQRLLCNHHNLDHDLVDPIKSDDGKLVCPICGQPWEDCIDEGKVKQTIRDAEFEIHKRTKALKEEERLRQMDLIEPPVKMHELPSYVEDAYKLLLKTGELQPFTTATPTMYMAEPNYPKFGLGRETYCPTNVL